MVRDLTYNTPRFDITTPDSDNESQQFRPTNPFVSMDDDDESTSSSENSYSGVKENNPFVNDNEYGRPFNAYNEFLNPPHNGTTSNLLSHGSSSDDGDIYLPHPRKTSSTHSYSQESSINVPVAFDRYPSIGDSKMMSSTSLNSQIVSNNAKNGPLSEFYENSPALSTEDPFTSEAEFSPFGGYPAQLFPLYVEEKEPDDDLHNPDYNDAYYTKKHFMNDIRHLDKRSVGGITGLIALLLIAIGLFVVFPVLTYSGVTEHYRPQSYEMLTSYEYPLLSAIRTSLIDPDTPQDALTHENKDGKSWELVFSDEFNVEGRTFYEEDDQFFTAPDIHYAATIDLEWYDPDAVTTANGTLNLRMDAYQNHDLFYRSGMVQSWNKLCYTQGLIMISARLPYYGSVSGLWPGLWTMGNLGRPGYKATTDGVWPYTYDSCDAGITANQSSPDGISYLPGQRLNKCVCLGQDHPNIGTGRGAPEIDIIEAEINNDLKLGVASQSYQIAPMDIWYYPDYNFVEIFDSDITTMNTYTGGPLQQAVSGTTTLNADWYQNGDGANNFQVYGYEYLHDNDDGYITWYVGEPTLTVHAYSLAPNGNVGFRRIAKEPMSIIMNLGISNSWAYIDWPSLQFPVTFSIDYVRLYQPADQKSVTCDPQDYPTYDYINNHANAYQDVNLTSWDDAGYKMPKNKLLHGC